MAKHGYYQHWGFKVCILVRNLPIHVTDCCSRGHQPWCSLTRNLTEIPKRIASNPTTRDIPWRSAPYLDPDGPHSHLSSCLHALNNATPEMER